MLKRITKFFLINGLLIASAIALFDAIAYFAAPESVLTTLREYRVEPPPEIPGAGAFLRDYWVAHEERGFDIGRNRQAIHRVDGINFDVWSNSLGCFDYDRTDVDANYVYLAGDSFTWGFAPFETKFGTLIDESSDLAVLKCGVAHTGQRHQFEKMTEIVGQIGHPPSAVFVFFYYNDIANDYAHPHSTVISGWQVDSVRLDNENRLLQIDRSLLESQSAARLRAMEAEVANRTGRSARIKSVIKRYSISASILSNLLPQRGTSADDNDGPARESNTTDRSLYDLPMDQDGTVTYSGNPFTSPNQEAVNRFATWARENDVALIFVLIPPADHYDSTRWHAEVRNFLEDREIRYLDLAEAFEASDADVHDIYWRTDGHFSPSGNRIVAEIISREFDDIL